MCRQIHPRIDCRRINTTLLIGTVHVTCELATASNEKDRKLLFIRWPKVVEVPWLQYCSQFQMTNNCLVSNWCNATQSGPIEVFGLALFEAKLWPTL